MIFIGVNSAIDAEKEVIFVDSIDEIDRTKVGSLVVLDFRNGDLDFYANAPIALAVKVGSIRDFLFLSAAKVKYALAEMPLAIELQKTAENYLLDIKVLAIADIDEIETIAKNSIDGIFCVKSSI
ncbi:hypothetical protein FACS189487_02960 [Campylobacterota bacterium]|nr:hypothetical protein FACS189487_02960 [Campylobacterota bacterium]